MRSSPVNGDCHGNQDIFTNQESVGLDLEGGYIGSIAVCTILLVKSGSKYLKVKKTIIALLNL